MMPRAIAAAALALALGGADPSIAAPRVEQMVVFRSGAAPVRDVVAREATIRVGGRRCTVAAGTPLAALVHSAIGRLSLRDYGFCSRRPADGGGLFVSGMRGDRNRGLNGWVYKVGTRAGTAGAADPSGPFGNGRLRAGARVTWFYCRLRAGGAGCQRTLATTSRVRPESVRVTVLAHDDEGRARPAAGATVLAGEARAVADRRGVATLTLPPGTHSLHAEQRGRVRSFPERLVVP